MKKILVTLVAMCASFFAMASAPISSTSFEELVTFNPTKDDVGGDTATYWGGIAGDSVLSNYSGAVGVTRPDLYNTGSNTNCLYLDTSNDTLDRYVNALDAEAHAPQAIGDGLYFDSLVQFTASDTPVEQFTVATGDKLAVWLLATEDDAGTTEVNEASTNLVVTAGYLGYGNVPTTKSYVISNLVVAAGSWHRLTIKAIGELGTSATAVAGFVVFVDGTAVTSTVAKADATGTVFDSLNATAAKWNTENALFPSIVPNTNPTAQTLSSVSFKGTGAIDDLVFTTQAPSFAVDAMTFSLNWDDGVNAVAYKLALEDASWTPATSNIAVSAAAGKVYLQVTYKSGYEAGTWTTDEATFTSGEGYVMAEFTVAPTISIVSKQNLFQVGEVNYATFAEAVANATGGATVKLLGNVSASLVLASGDDLVIDLAGNDLVAPVDGGVADPAIYINNGATLLVIDSVGGGVIASTSEYGAVLSEGALTIGAVTGDAGATINGIVYGAVFVKGQMTVADNEDYAQNGVTIPDGSEVDTIGGYYVVTVSGGQPEIPTYALTLPSVTGATAAVTTNGVAASTYTAIESNAAVVVTWTAQNGYKITAGATESFTMTSAKTAATPTVVAITYATVTITPVDNCTIAVSNGNAEVVSGAKFDVEDEVVLSVTRTAAEGYELTAGYAASENITATNDVTITAAVQAAGPADWPADPASVSGQTASAAFGIAGDLANADAATLATWAKANTVPYGSAILTDAFLLNCANTAGAVTAAAANFKITSIAVDGGTVTIEPANFGNGKVVIKGAATLGDTFVDPVTTSHRFFKGALAVPTMPE